MDPRQRESLGVLQRRQRRTELEEKGTSIVHKSSACKSVFSAKPEKSAGGIIADTASSDSRTSPRNPSLGFGAASKEWARMPTGGHASSACARFKWNRYALSTPRTFGSFDASRSRFRSRQRRGEPAHRREFDPIAHVGVDSGMVTFNRLAHRPIASQVTGSSGIPERERSSKARNSKSPGTRTSSKPGAGADDFM